MKILIAIPCLKRGGTEMQTLNLVRVLISEGHEVSTLCYFETDNLYNGIYFVRLPEAKNPVSVKVIIRK